MAHLAAGSNRRPCVDHLAFAQIEALGTPVLTDGYVDGITREITSGEKQFFHINEQKTHSLKAASLQLTGQRSSRSEGDRNIGLNIPFADVEDGQLDGEVVINSQHTLIVCMNTFPQDDVRFLSGAQSDEAQNNEGCNECSHVCESDKTRPIRNQKVRIPASTRERAVSNVTCLEKRRRDVAIHELQQRCRTVLNGFCFRNNASN